MNRFTFGSASGTPPVVKNLIIINVVVFVLTMLLGRSGLINLNGLLGMFYVQSPIFKPWQIVTHMFMHGSLFHIFFNMWALWIFGKTLESVWGGQRFLIYFFVTGIGAAFLHQYVMYLELAPAIETVKAQYNFDTITYERLRELASSNPGLYQALRTPTVGASGAVFGILLAFGMLFPNTPLFIIPFPFPIKAKWLVIGYGALELYLGVTQSGSNIAHFAHLGGMIFGFILIKYWNKNSNRFY